MSGGLFGVRSSAGFFGESVGATAELESELEPVGGGGAVGELDTGSSVISLALLPFVSTTGFAAGGVAVVVGGAVLAFGVAGGGAGEAGGGSRGDIEKGEVALLGELGDEGREKGRRTLTNRTTPFPWCAKR